MNEDNFTRTIGQLEFNFQAIRNPFNDDELFFVVIAPEGDPFIMYYDKESLGFKVQRSAPYLAYELESQLGDVIEGYFE